MTLPRWARVTTTLVPLGFLALFFAYPVASIVGQGLTLDGALDLEPLGRVFTDASLRRGDVFSAEPDPALLAVQVDDVLAALDLLPRP